MMQICEMPDSAITICRGFYEFLDYFGHFGIIFFEIRRTLHRNCTICARCYLYMFVSVHVRDEVNDCRFRTKNEDRFYFFL